jgi:hypothetical protein
MGFTKLKSFFFIFFIKTIFKNKSAEDEIRTRVALKAQAFQACAFDHSATSALLKKELVN